MFLVCHVGDCIDPDAVDSPLLPEMKPKLQSLFRQLAATHGIPRKLFVSPYRAGRESWANCQSLFTHEWGVDCHADPLISKRNARPDGHSQLATNTQRANPPIGESLDAFSERVAKIFYRYKQLAAREGPVWIITHSDVMLKMVELDGRNVELGDRPDFETYFKVGGFVGGVAEPAPLPKVRLGTAPLDVTGPPLLSSTPTIARHAPLPSAAASSTPAAAPPSSSNSAASSSSTSPHTCAKCGRNTAVPTEPSFAKSALPDDYNIEGYDPFQITKPGKARSAADKLKGRYRIVVTSTEGYTTQGEEFDASVKPPDSEMSFMGADEDDADDFVMASAATVMRINPAKLQGLNYIKKPIGPIHI